MSERIPKVLILDRMGGHLSKRMSLLGCEPVLANPRDISELKGLLEQHQPDWVHPGLGHWADHPELGILCQKHGALYLGPSARAIASLSNCLSLLLLADRLRIPHLVLGFDPMHSVRELEQLLEGRGNPFPFVLKSVHGNSGNGLKVIRDMEDLGPSLELWLGQLRVNYGESIVFIERYLEGARQIALPFARDRHGTLQFFTTLDVSLQYNYRRLIEMCGQDLVEPHILAKMHEAAERLLAHVGYVGLGTLEFLVEGDRFFLVSAKSRLQPSFVLWEKCDGVDAVALQLALHVELKNLKAALGTPSVVRAQRALGARIYAEDSSHRLPRPGTLREVIVTSPTEPKELWTEWLWTDEKEVLSTSEAFIGFVALASAESVTDSKQAWSKLFAQLVLTLKQVRIEGSLETNIQFLADIAAHSWIGAGLFHAGFLDEEYIPRLHPPKNWAELAAGLVLKAVEAPRVIVGNQAILAASGAEALAAQSKKVTSTVEGLGFGRFRVQLWNAKEGLWSLLVRVPEAGAAQVLSAQVDGRVYARFVLPGDWVEPHQDWLIIESMGVLVPHALSKGAYLDSWTINGDFVRMGEALAKVSQYR